jgi:hypothetical protein
MGLFRLLAMAPALTFGLLHVAPAQAGTLDTPACRRDLMAASAGVTDVAVRLKGLTRIAGEEKCTAYRQQFLVVVKARAVFANCKTGPDRDADVGRLDGTIEDINGVIAETCSVQ